MREYFTADDAILLIRPREDMDEMAAVCSWFENPIVVMSESNVDRQGRDRMRRFIRQTSTARVLICVGEHDIKDPEEFLLAGCFGFVACSTPPSVWEMIVRSVAAGHMWVEHSLLTSAFRTALAALDAPLYSHRESEILSLLAQGLSNQGIAQRLFVSQETIRWHLRKLYVKAGLTDRRALVAHATRLATALEPGLSIRRNEAGSSCV